MHFSRTIFSIADSDCEFHQRNFAQRDLLLRFEITLSGKAGRPKKNYRLNKAQVTLLITFLKNTEIVANFKVELVRQFYTMRAELQKRQMLRMQLKPIRRELTDAIQENQYSKWDYKLYTGLAYKH